MPFEIVHIRDSEKILKSKKVKPVLLDTLQVIDDVLINRF